eukprot:TRINITY_DN11817_c0_g1_i1.p1 TRINITY_DN11817_c0_g1~~TRINITY_DN11817_c0_g1_i1.p1  ORF type:complete len:469 (+),score=113.31 TRINITY_DN11817_c0_g1_i1:69-1475(+)
MTSASVTSSKKPSSPVRLKSHQLALQKAKTLSRSVLSGVEAAEKAVIADAERRKADDQGEREEKTSRLRAKIESCLRVVKASEQCNLHVQETLRQLRRCLRQLQLTRYAQFAELQVCEHRLQLRLTGPPEELVGDKAQKALRDQEQLIKHSREELLKLEAELKKAIRMIDEVRVALGSNAASQRHLAEHCRASIVSVQQALHVGDAAQADDEAPEESYEGLERAEYLLSAAAQLIERCGVAAQQTEKQCTRARTRSESLIAQRATESEQAAKMLRLQATDVDYTIATAERSLDKSSKRLSGRDEASKAAGLDRTKRLLRDLEQTRMQLKEEIQRKLAMQSIDESCRKVTTQSASAATMFSNTKLERRKQSRPATATGIRSESSPARGLVDFEPALAHSSSMPMSLPALASSVDADYSLSHTGASFTGAESLGASCNAADSVVSTAASTRRTRPKSACGTAKGFERQVS